MNKVSIYSLLFACLLASNPVHINADTSKNLINLLMTDPKVQLLGFGAVGYGISSIYFFKKYREDQSRLRTHNATVAGKQGLGTALNREIAKKMLPINVTIDMVGGAISLSGLAYFSYHLYHAIKQATS